MLEGLEAVELKLSEVLEESEDFRLDSEFFKKSFIILSKLVEKYIYLSEIAETYELHSNGSFANIYDILHDNKEKKINYIRSTNIKKFFIDGEIEKISLLAHNKLKKTQTKENDILVARTGKIGGASIITKEWTNSNSNQNVVNIRLKNKIILPMYLVTFLNSNYGINQFLRASTGNVQPWLNLSLLRKIKIPIFSQTFQEKIEMLVKTAYEKLQKSKDLYKQAEDLLLKELDLNNFKPSNKNIAVKTLKDSFLSTGRLDAEYYQPKYDEILNKIKNYGSDKISNICYIKDKNYKPKNEVLYKYIELSNIGNEGNITGYIKELGKYLPSRARRKVSFNDVIVSSIEGSLDKVALVNLSDENLLCSTGFYVINSEQINSETLLVLFKNKVFQQILKQNCSGTILTAINKDEFYNLQIPLIHKNIQIKIEQKIKESFNLKKQSKEFLDLAKKAVEIAIEKDENEAIKFLENEYD